MNNGRKNTSNCTDCLLDLTDACPRGAGRALDDEICDSFFPRETYQVNKNESWLLGYQQGREDVLNEKDCKKCYSKCLDCDKRIKAYNDGKADADKFLLQWKDDVMNSLCKYDANSIEEVYQLGINRGKKEMLNEFAKKVKDELRYYHLSVNDIDEIVEQLKKV